MNNEQPIIVGLDIGTTKIAVIAGRKNEFGKLEILGFGRPGVVDWELGERLALIVSLHQLSRSWQLRLNVPRVTSRVVVDMKLDDVFGPVKLHGLVSIESHRYVGAMYGIANNIMR